jgi:hypothetical protein
MTTLNYPRHFVLLVGATAVLALGLLVQPPWAPVADRLFVLFGLSGALHAVTVVLALQGEASWGVRVGFVAAATALSVAAPVGGLALASAFGAVSYWLLVRGFWAPFLSRGSLVTTIAACEVAMLFTVMAGNVVQIPRDPLAPALWWLGFSIALCIADRRHALAASRA